MDANYMLHEYVEDREMHFRAASPPIVQISNFTFKNVDSIRASFKDDYTTYLYSRDLSPTVDILEKKQAALDNAEDCQVFNSGAAAIFASVLANVKSGNHIVSVMNTYTWSRNLFDEIFARFNITPSYVDGRLDGIFVLETRENKVMYFLKTPGSGALYYWILRRKQMLPGGRGILLSAVTVIAPPLIKNRFNWE